jgi:coenzyme F420-0:L-glutamate ligase/coenzyme F420-1:gamma-L-glutamate ligase
MTKNELRVLPVVGLPEFVEGMRVGEETAARASALEDGDVVVISQKIVSKAEGQVRKLSSVIPGAEARKLAAVLGKEPGLVELILEQSTEVLRAERGVLIVETKHGFVCANAGVDASNVADGGLMLLPLDPDASARQIREGIVKGSGADVAVIVSDTFGRPWRAGYTEVAIGVAGMHPIVDYVGQLDTHGRELRATWICIADELASAAELVTGKLNRVPAALIRGYAIPRGDGSAREMVRQAESDMFR